MNSIFSYAYRTDPYIPVLRAYYDRADMPRTTRHENSHLHSVSEIMYVVDGEARVIVHPGVAVTLRRGQFIWLDAFVAHHLVLLPDTPCAMMNAEFDLIPSANAGCPSLGQLYGQSAAMAAMLDHPVPHLALDDPEGAVHALLKQIVRLGASAPAPRTSPHLLAALLLTIAHGRQSVEGADASPVNNPHVAAALRYIGEHYAEPVTALRIAEALHVHPSYLHRLFQRHAGKTVNECLRDARMRTARALLTSTDDSLPDIAAAVGISGQQYFVRLFKRVYGVSPSEYRKSHLLL